MRLRLAAACLLVLTGIGTAETDGHWRIGEKAPLFQLADLQGKQFSSDAFKGHPAVLFFAATWCPYSNRFSKAVESVHQRYKGKGVQVVLIDIKEDGDKARAKWVGEKGMTCPVLPDVDGTVTRAYAPPPNVDPKTPREDLMTAQILLLDKEGKIRHFPKPTENPAQIDWELKAVQAKLDVMLAKKAKKKA